MTGQSLVYRCRSDPQIAVEVIRTMASCRFRIFGSGTSSTWTVFLPIQHTAFIGSLHWL